MVAVAPRSASRRGARIDERVRAASNNVTTAMAGATDRGPRAHQLQRAVEEWTAEAEQVRRDLDIAERLTGDAHKQALQKLSSRADQLCTVAARIVETAFLGSLLPSDPELDGLRRAAERIDALEQAYRELDGTADRARVWSSGTATARVRALLPAVRRRPAS